MTRSHDLAWRSNVPCRRRRAIQWQHSYVAGNKTFCIYLADGEDSIRKRAELNGIPIAKITEVPQMIDSLTANN